MIDDLRLYQIRWARDITEKGKFLAFAHHVTTVDEVKEIVAGYRKKYYDARHCCYHICWVLNGPNSVPMMMANLLLRQENQSSAKSRNQIDGYFNCRHPIFRRVKLGTNGLIVAYREAAIDALAHCEEVTQQMRK